MSEAERRELTSRVTPRSFGPPQFLDLELERAWLDVCRGFDPDPGRLGGRNLP